MPHTHLPAAGPGLPISTLFRDARLREAFRRAERDHGQAFVGPALPRDPSPQAGAQTRREAANA